MKPNTNNYAFIDGANLYRGSLNLGWKLDYARFRVWLSDKYGVQIAYIFIGHIPTNKRLYQYLQDSGFMLVFKEVVYDASGKPKGNCDADLVVAAMKGAYENSYGQAVLVSSDGDYAGLVAFLGEKKKLSSVISPASQKKCSVLLKRTEAHIVYLSDQRSILESGQNKKAPDRDETL